MKKTIGLIIVLMLTLITLTGCAELNYEVEVNKDGTGEIFYIYGISKEVLGNSADLVEELVTSAKEQAEENGYIVDVYEDEEISGFQATKELKDVTADFSLQEVFEVFGAEYKGNLENSGIKIERTLFESKYLQNAELDLTDIEDEAKIKYTIKLPVTAKINNAGKVSDDGRTLTWDLKTGQINKIEFVAQEINVLPMAIIIVIIAVVIVLIVFMILKKKHATKKENNI